MNKVQVLGIDPGPQQSAYVLWDGATILEKGYQSNSEIAFLLNENIAFAGARLFIEMIGHYGTGMPAGKTVFDTCIWIGRFIECWSGRPYELILRPTVKAHVCGSAKAKDANVSRALKDRLGEPGTKKAPGLTYGVSGDIWAALAVAVCAHDRQVISAWMPARGFGQHFCVKDYGQITCPHCKAEITKRTFNQITCGRVRCQQAQNQANSLKRRGK